MIVIDQWQFVYGIDEEYDSRFDVPISLRVNHKNLFGTDIHNKYHISTRYATYWLDKLQSRDFVCLTNRTSVLLIIWINSLGMALTYINSLKILSKVAVQGEKITLQIDLICYNISPVC